MNYAIDEEIRETIASAVRSPRSGPRRRWKRTRVSPGWNGRFRSLKMAQLALRPVFVYSEAHVRGHLFLCLPAYYLEWHLRRALAPLLFEERDRSGARALRKSPVEKAQVSERTKAKTARTRTADGLPAQSFRTLLPDLGALTLNQVTLPHAPQHPFAMFAQPMPVQAQDFELLGVDPTRFVASKWPG